MSRAASKAVDHGAYVVVVASEGLVREVILSSDLPEIRLLVVDLDDFSYAPDVEWYSEQLLEVRAVVAPGPERKQLRLDMAGAAGRPWTERGPGRLL